MRGSRGFIVAAVASGALALTACGDDPSAGTGSRQPLSQHQYEEFERLYRAQVDAEARYGTDAAKVAETTAAACERTDRDDRLLAAMVKGCDEMLEFVKSAGNPDCAGPRDCASFMRSAATKLDKVLISLDDAEDVVNETVSSAACRRALTTPQLTRALRGLRDAMNKMADAMTDGDERAITAAGERFAQQASDYEAAASAEKVFKRFRRACAPDA